MSVDLESFRSPLREALWFEAAGVRTPVPPAGEVVFDHNAMAMQAALDGVGVAVAQPLYVTDALKAGRLVAPFPFIATKQEAWYLEYRPVREQDPALLAFRRWLRDQAEQQRQVEAEMLQRSMKAASKMAGRSRVHRRLPRPASYIRRRGAP